MHGPMNINWDARSHEHKTLYLNNNIQSTHIVGANRAHFLLQLRQDLLPPDHH